MKESNNNTKTVEIGEGCEDLDFRELTAPCGLACFDCDLYLANFNEEIRKKFASGMAQTHGLPYDEVYNRIVVCKGCRNGNGCSLMPEPCKVLKCINSKEIESCADCDDFPCDYLQPYADKASEVPHNTKVYNLALIRKMGVEKWAQKKAKQVKDTYFNGKWNI